MSFQRCVITNGTKLNIVGFSHSQYEKDWASFTHSHNFTEIFVVLSGNGYMQAENKTYEMNKNDIFIINSPTLHHEESNSDKPLEYLAISVKNIYFTNKENENYSEIIQLKNQKKELILKIEQAWQEFKNKKQYFNEYVESLLKIFIISFTRENDLVLNSLNKAKNQFSTYHPAVNYLIKRIEENFNMPLNLDEIAKKYFITKQYLIKKTKETLNMSPIKYLTAKRIEEAKYLLKNSDLIITEISTELGFCTSAYFAKIFKSLTSKTPMEYKKMHLKNV